MGQVDASLVRPPAETSNVLTGHRCRDDGHIYETILSLLICHSHIVCDGLESLFKSIRKLLSNRPAIKKAPCEGKAPRSLGNCDYLYSSSREYLELQERDALAFGRMCAHGPRDRR